MISHQQILKTFCIKRPLFFKLITSWAPSLLLAISQLTLSSTMRLTFSVIEIWLNLCGILAVELIFCLFGFVILKKAFIGAVCLIGFVHSNSLPYELFERKNGKPFTNCCNLLVQSFWRCLSKCFSRLIACTVRLFRFQGAGVPTISVVGGTPAAAGEFPNIVILLFYSKKYLKFF